MGAAELPPPELENDLRAELKDSRIERLGGLTEDRRARIRAVRLKRQRKINVRQIQIDIVESIISIGAELKRFSFSCPKAAPDGNVCVSLARAAIMITRQSAICSKDRLRKYLRAEHPTDEIAPFKRGLDGALSRRIRTIVVSTPDAPTPVHVVVATEVKQGPTGAMRSLE